MKRIVTCFLLGLLAYGCQEVVEKKVSDYSKKDKWAQVRAEVAQREVERRLAQGDIDGARKELENAVRSGATDANLYILLARIDICQGRFKEADWAIERASRLDPQLAAVDGIRGVLKESQAMWESARLAYVAQARKASNHVIPVLNQARVLHAAGRPAEALSVLRSALRERPDSAPLVFAAGVALLATGDSEAAINHLRRAMALGYDQERSRLLLALALHVAERHEEAFATLGQLKQPACPEQVQLILARSALAAGQATTASDNFRKYLEAHPEDADAWLDLARALVLQERLVEAAEAVERAASQRPDDPDVYVLRGHVQNLSGQSLEAASSYVKATGLGADVSVLSKVMKSLYAKETLR